MNRVAAWIRHKPALAAAAVYAVLAVAFFSPALLPGKALSNSDDFWFAPPWDRVKPAQLQRSANFEFGDTPALFQAFTRYARRQLPHVPLWNPYLMSGRPFLANAQSAVFSPFTVPSYVLPFWRSLAIVAALKLFVAAFGTFLLARRLGMRLGGALLAGVVYGFNLWLVTWVSFPHASVWALLPWLLLLTDMVVTRPGLLSAAGLSAAVALQFLGGHPESSAHVLVVTALFFCLRLFQARRQEVKPPALPVLAAFGGSLVAGVALAGATLVPSLELVSHSADIRQRTGVLGHLPAKQLAMLVLPDYWGRPTATPLQPFLISRAVYAGALPLLLAVLALIVRPALTRVAVAAFGVLCLMVVFGLPPGYQLLSAVPGSGAVHATRLAIVSLLCLALLAGWGLDELSARARPRRLRIAVAAATAIALAPLAWLAIGRPPVSSLGFAAKVALGVVNPPVQGNPSVPNVVRLAALLAWVALAGAGLALILLRGRGRLPAAVFAALAVGLVAVDLFHAGMGYNPAIDESLAAQPATGGIRYVQHRSPERYSAVEAMRLNAGMNYDLLDARGYDLPVEQRYDTLWRSQVSPEFSSQRSPFGYQAIGLTLPRLSERRLRTLSLLGVRYLMVPWNRHVGYGLRLVYRGRDSRVYSNDRAVPRALVAPVQRIVEGGSAALRAVTRPGFDARRVAVVEGRLPEVRTVSGAAAPTRPAGSARIVSYAPERVVVRARAGQPGVLLLNDAFYPGWQARIDGKAAEVERVDYVLRGVVLPGGAHTVEFTYQPSSWRLGWIVSLVALLGVGVTAAWSLGRRRI